jgi:ribonuclease D
MTDLTILEPQYLWDTKIIPVTDNVFNLYFKKFDYQTHYTVQIVSDLPYVTNWPLSLDLETTGLEFNIDTIELVSVRYHGTSDVYLIPVHGKRLPVKLYKTIQESNLVVMHHAMFDATFLYAHEQLLPQNMYCTRAGSKMYTERTGEYCPRLTGDYIGKPSNSLKDLVYGHCGIEMDKSLAVSNWRGELSLEQIQYAAMDVIFLEDLYITFAHPNDQIHMQSIQSRVYERVTGYNYLRY